MPTTQTRVRRSLAGAPLVACRRTPSEPTSSRASRHSEPRRAARAWPPAGTESTSVLSVHLAVDLGAESGRVLAGRIEGDRLVLDEVHRFPNRAVPLPDRLAWDVLGLYANILDGIR